MSTTKTELVKFLDRTFRDRNGPASDADVQNRLSDAPEDAIIVEGHVELAQLADAVISHLASSPSDAAEDAFAILESSGITPAHSDSWTVGEPDNLARIAADLQHHIERRDARTKEAAEREALEGEALDLLNAFRAASGLVRVDSFEGYDHARPQWIAVAQSVRKARELHGATK